MLTPEHSIYIQNDLGADIAMQLDDVVSSKVSGPRVEEAMYRTTRWLDRCLKVHTRPHDQNIFPIIQGGLQPELRMKSVSLQTDRNVSGFAIGGLRYLYMLSYYLLNKLKWWGREEVLCVTSHTHKNLASYGMKTKHANNTRARHIRIILHKITTHFFFRLFFSFT